MFAKLLKYEWKASAGLLSILSLALLGVGLLMTVFLHVITVWEDQIPAELWGPIWVLLGGSILAVFAYLIGTRLILLIRFYKNKFTDEGYLTFTLPVTSHQILLSSLVNFLLWSVITTVAAGGTILLAVTLGTGRDGIFHQNAWDLAQLMFVDIWKAELLESYSILNLINAAVSKVSGVVVMVTAVTLGAVMAKKHKLLAAFGFYYAINMLMSILSSMVSIFCVISGVGGLLQGSGGDRMLGMLNGAVIFQLVLNIAVLIAGYFVSNWLIKKKLNLP